MKTFLAFVLALVCATLALAQGTLVHDTLFSAALNQNRLVDVYLPQGYDTSQADYPVIYFLHGMGENAHSYGPITLVLDNLIATHVMQPTIVVKPDGSVPPYGGSMYTNSALYGAFEDYIVYDLVDYIDTEYRTVAERDSRTIMGHSMGGYGSMKLALKHPDLFLGVASLSGWLNLTPFDFWQQQVLMENSGHGPYDPEAGFFTLAAYSAAGAFTPNLSAPPYYVDFPLDSAGNTVDSVLDRWQHEMPGWFAAQDTNVRQVAIYFDCGTEDELGFYPMNQAFAATLDSLDIPHRFVSFAGGHYDQLIGQGILALLYLDSLMQAGTPANDARAVAPQAFELGQNYPNPFNASTQIVFELKSPGFVALSVYNVLGQQLAVLEKGYLTQGRHELTFHASDLPSGLYVYRMESSGYQTQRRMLLLK